MSWLQYMKVNNMKWQTKVVLGEKEERERETKTGGEGERMTERETETKRVNQENRLALISTYKRSYQWTQQREILTNLRLWQLPWLPQTHRQHHNWKSFKTMLPHTNTDTLTQQPRWRRWKYSREVPVNLIKGFGPHPYPLYSHPNTLFSSCVGFY